ncbi:hypothetical protein R9X47_05000 [Wukongibacter baidiensis]|uniref:hypothetical protein n=1 Tax=Wukongibacter baidiensis TaxID=1723361 RepID=UPI003D7F2C0F
MSKDYVRKKSQLLFLNSNKEIQVGRIEDLPLSIDYIKKIDRDSLEVQKVFKGFTSIVYKIKVDGKSYALKKKREKAVIRNIDARVSFLNEIQRRRDFENLKKTAPRLYDGIVKTIYASLNNGFILSPWINGDDITLVNGREVYENLFDTIHHMECNGFFEWDPCPGNILVVNGNQVKLFDFGYNYVFNPLSEYNSAGKKEPIFHGVERFETRTFMGELLVKVEDMGEDRVLTEYKVEKEAALKYFEKKLRWLEEQQANDDIIIWMRRAIERCELGLTNEDSLKRLYILESFRSYVLDVNIDIAGKWCNWRTLKQVDRILKILNRDYDLLKQDSGLFWGDELLSKKKLIEKYKKSRDKVIEYKARDDEYLRKIGANSSLK